MVTVNVRVIAVVIASFNSFSTSNSTMRNTLYILTRLCFYNSINTTSSAERSSLECSISCSQYGSCDIFRFCKSETTLDCDFLHSYVPNYDVRCLNTSSTWMCKYSRKITLPVNSTSTAAMTTPLSHSATTLHFQSTHMMSTTPNNAATTTQNSAATTTQNSAASTTEHSTTPNIENPTTQGSLSTTSGGGSAGSGEDD